MGQQYGTVCDASSRRREEDEKRGKEAQREEERGKREEGRRNARRGNATSAQHKYQYRGWGGRGFCHFAHLVVSYGEILVSLAEPALAAFVLVGPARRGGHLAVVGVDRGADAGLMPPVTVTVLEPAARDVGGTGNAGSLRGGEKSGGGEEREEQRRAGAGRRGRACHRRRRRGGGAQDVRAERERERVESVSRACRACRARVKKSEEGEGARAPLILTKRCFCSRHLFAPAARLVHFMRSPVKTA